jgi:hypothetical protein
VQGKAIYKSAAAMAAASGRSYLSVLPASTSAIPFLSPQNAAQLAQAKQGTTSYGFITGELRVKGVTALCYLHLLHLFPSRQFLIQTRGS